MTHEQQYKCKMCGKSYRVKWGYNATLKKMMWLHLGKKTCIHDIKIPVLDNFE